MLDVGWVIGWGKGVLPAGYDVRFLSWLRVSLCLRCYLRCLRNWANRGHAPAIWGWWFPPICRWYRTILHEHFDASDQRPPLIGDFQWFWRDWSIAPKETDLHWCGWHFTWERPLARGHPWTSVDTWRSNRGFQPRNQQGFLLWMGRLLHGKTSEERFNWTQVDVYLFQSTTCDCSLWLCQNSYWKWPFIVSFPINSMVIFHSYVSLPKGKLNASYRKWCFVQP